MKEIFCETRKSEINVSCIYYLSVTGRYQDLNLWVSSGPIAVMYLLTQFLPSEESTALLMRKAHLYFPAQAPVNQ